MSTKYVYSLHDGSLSFSPSSHAAMALEMLLKQDPELLPAMLKARYDVDGLRTMAQRLNAIQPGLYQTLRDDFNSEDVFPEGQGHVSDVLESINQGRGR